MTYVSYEWTPDPSEYLSANRRSGKLKSATKTSLNRDSQSVSTPGFTRAVELAIALRHLESQFSTLGQHDTGERDTCGCGYETVATALTG